MASDHRGRELHAGKRTAQERGWRERSWTYNPLDTTNSGLMYTKGDMGRAMIVSPSVSSKGHTWTTQGDVPAGEYESGDLGKGKTSMVATRPYDSDTNFIQVRGTVRTPARALIAAEAMNKRIEEGRDLKTGRPKK